MTTLNANQKLVLFDGVCNLCDSSVQFIIKHDKKNVFLFTTLQGETAKPIISSFKIDTEKTDSILLFTPKRRLYTKSTAALRIAAQLQFPINLLSVFLIIPKFIRDYVYDFIAKNRYRWYGKKEACMIPTKALKVKFLT
ncbi:thiol-disulfide oxidoreductase DCC family protein [Formosa algae]|uniref:DCC family thiol-disulfide oxidoreductase YuxK n=1 Tax=Formosa algae TaxID=225843 RepID=A0A9X1CDF3_9FLAO|nr:thiol-disulfide oxidoreductase DCC family protein [Formosa algae]MBP1841174.1 putative DCC family thiol-disulfide oxidoreductase YuxK [Formosa algae]MDQ0336406.1 putative DCC family thiol-disulfide oxidoreductase YuxK [Formosa algae]OEI81370.1 thiol-disulfide oxidoreductase [Formosa algae]